MYLDYYGLEDFPFRLAPDPKYLFRTESLVEVLANLEYGIGSGKGLIVVTGEVGTGKTTALRSNLKSLDLDIFSAYIFNPLLSTDEFFDTMLSEFRIRPEPSKSAMLRAMGYMLLSRHLKGLRTVLVIDEAHLLPPYLLEEIRLLSNFETNQEKLLQIVLCGQPELVDLLEQPELRQLKQRVSLRCEIEPLSAYQTSEYIKWRLHIAGAKKLELFEPEAVSAIHMFSEGIPRIINNICDNALLNGFSEGRRTIPAQIVTDVVEVLGLGGPPGPRGAQTSQTWVSNTARSAQLAGVGGPSTAAAGDDQYGNVHYLRRQETVLANRRTRQPGGDGNVRFIIEFDNMDAAVAPARFFSRVKVTRQ
jgi:general secretion pathway protein A